MSAKIDPSSFDFNDADQSVDDSIFEAEQHKSAWKSVIEILNSDKLKDYSKFKLKKAGVRIASYICAFQILFNFWRVIYITEPGVPLALRLVNYVKCIVPLTGCLSMSTNSRDIVPPGSRLQKEAQLLFLEI
jgi:hypothetical protein